MIDCGLYIHVPFCETKCGYCDFYSVALKGRPTTPLVDRLVTEARRRLSADRLNVRTVFVGGGTPTLLPPAELRRLLDVVPTDGIEEFTVEANPATLDDENLPVMTDAGVDRISMGAQSWHPSELQALERLHSPDDIAPGVALARKHGVKRINLDLMFGIGGQTLDTWRESLRQTMDLQVEHISCYGLTYEPGTRLTAQLHSGKITPCDEGLERDMYLLAIEVLSAHGFEQYEISNFARPGQRCLHNLIYWRNEPYVGVGPSAAGYLHGVRYKNVPDIDTYIRKMDARGDAVMESESVTSTTLAGEILMMGLRLTEGVSIPRLVRQTGIDPREACPSSLARFVETGLVSLSDDRLTLTRQGRLLADYIISDLFAELHIARGDDGSVPIRTEHSTPPVS